MNKILALPIVAVAAVFLPRFTASAVDSITVLNPSFQSDNYATFPGYVGQPGNPGEISGWTGTGGRGVNGPDIGASTPFADNGTIPDSSRVAFLQGTGSLSQELFGFTVGDLYWIQGFANARAAANSNDTPLVSVSIAGTPLLVDQPVLSVGGANPYNFVNLPWTASAAQGALLINSRTLNGGDGTLTLDGISVIRRTVDDVVIANPSFEASGTDLTGSGNGVGYVNSLAGWTVGTAGGQAGFGFFGSPFHGGGSGNIPEGATFALLQRQASITQDLLGLTVGQTYRLSLDYVARAGTDMPEALFTIDGETAFSGLVSSVGADNTFFHLDYEFVADGTTAALSLANVQAADVDNTLFVDNVRVVAVPEPSSAALVLLGGMLALRRRKTRA